MNINNGKQDYYILVTEQLRNIVYSAEGHNKRIPKEIL